MWRWGPSCHVSSASNETRQYVHGRCLKPVFYTTTEVLFCIPTRSVLIALLARMMLQAEVSGLDAGKPGSVGLGQESSGHAENRTFLSPVPFFKVQKIKAISSASMPSA